MLNKNLKYVLITAAKNEAQFIELTIKSVITQTVLPQRWIIINDGSTDTTEEIVKKYALKYPWIELISLPVSNDRNFGRKAIAFNIGYQRIMDLDFDIIGNLDADISFNNNYFSFLLKKFLEFPELGVAGTPFREGGKQYDYRFSNIEHVSGACQLFRRKCFESIGGYIPLEAGGIDLYMNIRARMAGWKTRTFTEMFCVHHRKMGAAKKNKLSFAFDGGYHDYLMGVSFIWQFLRSAYRLISDPIFSFCIMAGYSWALITRPKRLVEKGMIEFVRNEQRQRIRKLIFRVLSS